jgi:drug/metabolite transporter (DMT)-like permease
LSGRAHHPPLHWALLACLVLIWGTTYIGLKIALTGFGPLTVIAARLILASVVLLAIAAAAGTRLPRGARAWTWMLWLAMLGNCLPFYFITWGTQHIDSSLAGILVAVMPLAVLVLAHFALDTERITPPKAAGFLLGFLGVAVLLGPELPAVGGSGGQLLAGQLAVLLGALLYAANAVSARRMPPLDPIAVSLATLLIASVVMVAAALVVREPIPESPPAAAVWAVVWMGVFPTAVATIAYFELIRIAGPTFMSLTNYLTPGIGVVLSIAVLGEQPGWEAYVGLALILAGVALAQARALGRWRGGGGA